MSSIKRLCTKCGKTYEGKGGCPNCKNKHKKKYEEENREKLDILYTTRWKRLRLRVIDMDGGICVRCWKKYHIINTEHLEAHHIKSREHHPELMWEEDNIITVCKTCNLQLGTRDKLDFEWSPKEREDNDYELI